MYISRYRVGSELFLTCPPPVGASGASRCTSAFVGENGASEIVSMFEPATGKSSMNPVTLSNAESISTVPPAGAFVHELDAGLLTVTAAVLFELLYVAVIVEDPDATPVTGILAEVCPADTVTVAGTVALVGSELLTDTDAADAGALDRVIVKPCTAPTETPREDGESELTVGFAGVEPSVVKLMTGFNSMLLFNVPVTPTR